MPYLVSGPDDILKISFVLALESHFPPPFQKFAFIYWVGINQTNEKQQPRNPHTFE